MTKLRNLKEPSMEDSTLRLRALCARISTGAVCLAALLAPGARNAPAQQTAVCSEMPGTGERIECTQDATSSDEIRLNLKGWVSF